MILSIFCHPKASPTLILQIFSHLSETPTPLCLVDWSGKWNASPSSPRPIFLCLAPTQQKKREILRLCVYNHENQSSWLDLSELIAIFPSVSISSPCPRAVTFPRRNRFIYVTIKFAPTSRKCAFSHRLTCCLPALKWGRESAFSLDSLGCWAEKGISIWAFWAGKCWEILNHTTHSTRQV